MLTAEIMFQNLIIFVRIWISSCKSKINDSSKSADRCFNSINFARSLYEIFTKRIENLWRKYCRLTFKFNGIF